MSQEKLAFSKERINKATSYNTTQANDSVLLRRAKGDPEPVSVPSFVKHHCLIGGSQLALAVKRKGDWMKWTYSQYYKEIRLAARGFIKLGLEPFYAVCIYGFNSPEWLIANLGAIFAQGFATGLYPTNSASTNEYLMNNSRCQILVVDNRRTLKKVESILENVKTLKKVVIMEEDEEGRGDEEDEEGRGDEEDEEGREDEEDEEGGGDEEDDYYILWKDLLELGRSEPDDKILSERLNGIAANQCCSLIYTSGTTGSPKGVMLSHDNITFTATALVEKHDWSREVSVVSFLPLSHIAANMLDIFVTMRCRGQVYFADKDAMKGSLIDTLREVRPTLFFAVPRMYEKFQEGILDKFNKTKKHEKILASLFTSAALSYNTKGRSKLTKSIGERLFYHRVRQSLGLERCQEFICGGAPLMSSTEDFFLGLDIIIKPGYGLSECGCVSNFASNEYKKGSCGSLFPSTKLRIAKDSESSPEGEFLIRGRGVMMGYLNNPAAMKEAFNEEGFFKTGDLGIVDKDGFHFITGRKKELLITAGGENISPVLIENNIKDCLPVVSHVVAIGDLKKFISVFLTLKVVRDENGGPSTLLSKSAREWCSAQGSNAERVTDIIRDQPPGVMRAIQMGIDEANERAVSNAAKVKKWTLLPRELSMDSGEIGPTLKLKRKVFSVLHSKQIDKFYS